MWARALVTCSRVCLQNAVRWTPVEALEELARRHRGKDAGDVNDAANWSCPRGDASQLKVGGNGVAAGMILAANNQTTLRTLG